MSNCSPHTQLSYNDTVMNWGNQSPWDKLGVRLDHKTSFRPEDVVTDGKGNILSMPTLERKPCFARPEAVFRHGKLTKKIRLKNGKIVDSTKHQCGSCPAGVREACMLIAAERVLSDPAILQAFRAWRDDCKKYFAGELAYTGLASNSWGAFKRAIADRGPFESPNDAALAKLMIEKNAAKRLCWASQKRVQRQKERERAKASEQLPSVQFVLNLEVERDHRFEVLRQKLGQPDQPPSIARVPAKDRQATARITANAWAVRELLKASHRKVRPGTIARLMADNNLSAGVPVRSMRSRISKDLKRADRCEQDGLWKPFDPDGDLEDYETGDDDAADSLCEPIEEIADILRNLEPEFPWETT